MEKPEEVAIRRAPKILPWALTGAVFGILLAVVLYLLIPEANRSGRDPFGLLLVSLGSLGLGAGIAFAIVVDLFTASKAKTAQAVRTEREAE